MAFTSIPLHFATQLVQELPMQPAWTRLLRSAGQSAMGFDASERRSGRDHLSRSLADSGSQEDVNAIPILCPLRCTQRPWPTEHRVAGPRLSCLRLALSAKSSEVVLVHLRCGRHAGAYPVSCAAGDFGRASNLGAACYDVTPRRQSNCRCVPRTRLPTTDGRRALHSRLPKS